MMTTWFLWVTSLSLAFSIESIPTLSCTLLDTDKDEWADRVQLEWSRRIRDQPLIQYATFRTQNATLLHSKWDTGDVANDAIGYLDLVMDFMPIHEQQMKLFVSVQIQPDMESVRWECVAHFSLFSHRHAARALSNPFGSHLLTSRQDFLPSNMYDTRSDVIQLTFSVPLEAAPRIGAFYYVDRNNAGATGLVDVIDWINNGTVVVVKTNHPLVASDFGQFGDAIRIYQPQFVVSEGGVPAETQEIYLTSAKTRFPDSLTNPFTRGQILPQSSPLHLTVGDSNLRVSINLVAIKYGTLSDQDIQNMQTYLQPRTP